jgi:hypothetical protein
MSNKVIYHFDKDDNVVSSIYDGDGKLKENDYGIWAKYNGMYATSKEFLIKWRIKCELEDYQLTRSQILVEFQRRRALLTKLNGQLSGA